MLTGWKNDPDTAWLYEVSNVALQQGLQHLQHAYVNFWAKRARYPEIQVQAQVAGVGDIHHVRVPVPRRADLAREDVRAAGRS